MTGPWSSLDDLQPIRWTDADPARLDRDQCDVAAFDLSLQYALPGTQLDAGFVDEPQALAFENGGWFGVLPVWPFTRPAPDGLAALAGEVGLKFLLSYPAAYPMIPPTIYPLSPEPEIVERTQATWHVLPSGGLCLLQSDGAWQPEASLVDLLLKAAGWRIEYALMKASVIEQMSVSGIVSDPSLDHLITTAAQNATREPKKPADQTATGYAATPDEPVPTSQAHST